MILEKNEKVLNFLIIKFYLARLVLTKNIICLGMPEEQRRASLIREGPFEPVTNERLDYPERLAGSDGIGPVVSKPGHTQEPVRSGENQDELQV